MMRTAGSEIPGFDFFLFIMLLDGYPSVHREKAKIYG